MEKITTNIPGFEVLTRGGIPRGRTTLVTGRSGTGKSIFALQVACSFASAGEPAIYVAVEERPGDLQATADSLGFGASALMEARALQLSDQKAELAVAVGPTRAGSCRVLVVDDNRDAAELLAEVLEDAGYVTRVAHDGPGALCIAADFRPQLGLLDIGLPVMDGFELARRMRELPGCRAMALVALTGYGQPADRELSRLAGFDLHLTKPFDVPELQAVVARFASMAALADD